MQASDASARQATRALVSVDRQLTGLREVLAAVGASAPTSPLKRRRGEEAGAAAGAGGDGALRIGKNTIVRSVLNELTNSSRTYA
jgi:hypothetical protein